jgi:pimeloyl-ACP methyl ester carboxylesterase
MFDGRQYERQVAELRERYRCVTVDFRGQGRSTSARGNYGMDEQTADVIAVIRALQLAPVHLVGLSMGGFVGLRVAARRPELLRSLTLLNTSARRHQMSKVPLLLALTGIARIVGIGPRLIVSAAERELYGRRFRDAPDRAGEREVWRRRWRAADRAPLARTMLAVLVRADVRQDLPHIVVPTLIIAGGDDASLPPYLAEEMHRLIPGSRLVVVPGVGHSTPIEDPETVTRVLQHFLDGLPAPARVLE